MFQSISTALPEIEAARRELNAIKGAQVFSKPTRERLHNIATNYFSTIRPSLINIDGIGAKLERVDEIFQELLSVSRKSASKNKCVRLLRAARQALIEFEGAIVAGASKASSGARTAADNLIIDSLNDICPSAALAYDQALRDLELQERLSYRGPATDLREALRETLDTLAPDTDVEAAPGFKLEVDAKRPTMKQKVRYILRNRGVGAGQLAAPESAVEGIEGIIGALVRSVYTRSSVSTHVATQRPEVLRIHAWVRLVLCELLEIPI
jgi:Predicted pPIWI-associating nuclease